MKASLKALVGKQADGATGALATGYRLPRGRKPSTKVPGESKLARRARRWRERHGA